MAFSISMLSPGSAEPQLGTALICRSAAGGLQLADKPQPPEVYREIPEQDRKIGQLLTEFVRRVVMTAADLRISEQAAVPLVAMRDAFFWQQLPARMKLIYSNYTRWKSKLKQDGTGKLDFSNWQVLVPDWSRGCRGRKGDDAWWMLFQGIHKGSGELGVRMAYDEACRTWRRKGFTDGVPKINHVKYWVKAYDDKLAALRYRKGKTEFTNKVVGYIQRDWSAIKVGEIWIGDNRKADCFIRVWDEEKQAWLPKRLYITAWRDAKSGKFVGWLLYPGDETPDSKAIIQCLVLATLDNGGVPPACVYIDNGKDFCAQGFIDPVTIFGVECSIALAMGIENIHALVYNPKAKLIENSFKTLVPYFDKKMPGYCGGFKGSKFDEAWKWAKANVARLPNLEQARELFTMAIADHEERLTSSLVQEGIRTVDLWEKRELLRPPMTQEELHLRCLLPLGESDMREIRRGPDGPSIQYDSGWYSSEKLIAYARQHWGEKVRLLIDAFAMKTIRAGKPVPVHLYCADPEGRIIDRILINEIHAARARTDEEREALGDAMRKIKRLEQDTKAVYRGLTGRREPAAPLQVEADWLHQQKALPAPVPTTHVGPNSYGDQAGDRPGGRSATGAVSPAADPDKVKQFAAFLQQRGEETSEEATASTMLAGMAAYQQQETED